jgi:hypothetical protein
MESDGRLVAVAFMSKGAKPGTKSMKCYKEVGRKFFDDAVPNALIEMK